MGRSRHLDRISERKKEQAELGERYPGVGRLEEEHRYVESLGSRESKSAYWPSGDVQAGSVPV